MPAKKTTETKEELSFEQALARLSSIAEILENENPPLEEALALYEEGAALLKNCAKQLTQAEEKITVLSKNE